MTDEMENNETKKKCCICCSEYEGEEHDPQPIRPKGKCCKECFERLVAPAIVPWEIRQRRNLGREKVYISGPIAHYDREERLYMFGNAERVLRVQGYEPVNPFKNGLPADAHWKDHMRADIRMLVECDIIYMLRGWELSKGAKLELDVASSCGLQVLYQ